MADGTGTDREKERERDSGSHRVSVTQKLFRRTGGSGIAGSESGTAKPSVFRKSISSGKLESGKVTKKTSSVFSKSAVPHGDSTDTPHISKFKHLITKKGELPVVSVRRKSQYGKSEDVEREKKDKRELKEQKESSKSKDNEDNEENKESKDIKDLKDLKGIHSKDSGTSDNVKEQTGPKKHSVDYGESKADTDDSMDNSMDPTVKYEKIEESTVLKKKSDGIELKNRQSTDNVGSKESKELKKEAESETEATETELPLQKRPNQQKNVNFSTETEDSTTSDDSKVLNNPENINSLPKSELLRDSTNSIHPHSSLSDPSDTEFPPSDPPESPNHSAPHSATHSSPHGSPESATVNQSVAEVTSETETVIARSPPGSHRKRHPDKRRKRIYSSSGSEDTSEPHSPLRHTRIRKRHTPSHTSSHTHNSSDSTDSEDSATFQPPKSTQPRRSATQSSRNSSNLRRDANGRLALQRFCDKGKFSDVQRIIQQGCQLNARDYAGNTALHEAALNGYLRIAQYLLDHGAFVNTRSGPEVLDTPLIDAVANGQCRRKKSKSDFMNDKNLLRQKVLFVSEHKIIRASFLIRKFMHNYVV